MLLGCRESISVSFPTQSFLRPYEKENAVGPKNYDGLIIGTLLLGHFFFTVLHNWSIPFECILCSALQTSIISFKLHRNLMRRYYYWLQYIYWWRRWVLTRVCCLPRSQIMWWNQDGTLRVTQSLVHCCIFGISYTNLCECDNRKQKSR